MCKAIFKITAKNYKGISEVEYLFNDNVTLEMYDEAVEKAETKQLEIPFVKGECEKDYQVIEAMEKILGKDWRIKEVGLYLIDECVCPSCDNKNMKPVIQVDNLWKCAECSLYFYIEEKYLKDVTERYNNQKVYVNVYSVTREYGGAEEGGWYYDHLLCQEVVPCKRKHAKEVRQDLHEEYKHLIYGDISSVLGGREVWIYVEDRPAQSETREKPIYE